MELALHPAACPGAVCWEGEWGSRRGLSIRMQGSRGGSKGCVYSKELQVRLGAAASNVSGNPRYTQRKGLWVNIREAPGVC